MLHPVGRIKRDETIHFQQLCSLLGENLSLSIITTVLTPDWRPFAPWPIGFLGRLWHRPSYSGTRHHLASTFAATCLRIMGPDAQQAQRGSNVKASPGPIGATREAHRVIFVVQVV